MRRIVILTIGGLFLLTALAALLAFGLAQGWQRPWLIRQIETQLASALGHEVQIESIEGTLYKELLIRELRLGESSAPFAQIEALHLRFDSLALFETDTAILSLAEVSLDGIRLDLRQRADLSWPWKAEGEPSERLPEAAPSAESAPPVLGLRVGRARLNDLRAFITPNDRATFAIKAEALAEGLALGDRFSLDTVSAQASVEGAENSDVPRLDARLAGALQGETLTIEALSFEGEIIGLAADPGAKLVIRNQITSLEDFVLRPTQGEGSIALSGSVSTEAAMKEGANSEAWERSDQTQFRLASSGFPLQTVQPLLTMLDLDLAGLLIADLRVAGTPSGLALSGFASLEQTRLRFRSGRIAGGHLKAELAGQLESPRATLSGGAAEIVMGEIPLGKGSWGGRITPSTLHIDTFTLEEGALELQVRPGARLRWNGEQIDLAEFELVSEGQRVRLSGAASAQEAKALHIELEAFEPKKALAALRRLGLIEAETAENEIAIGGQIQGTLLASGTREWPELKADLSWTSPQLGSFSFDSIKLAVETEDKSWLVSTNWRRQAKQVLHGEATLPRGRVLTEPMTLLADGGTRLTAKTERFELGSLKPFLPRSVEMLGGSLSLSVQAEGRATRPRLSGQVLLEKGALGVSALGSQTFSPIQAKGKLQDGRIEIETFRIGEGEQEGKGEGFIDGRALLVLDGGKLASVDSTLDLHSYPIDAPGLVTGALTGALHLAGPVEKPDLKGRLVVAGLDVRIPDADDPTLKEIRIITSEATATETLKEERSASSILDPLRVDVGVRLSKNSWARGRGAEVELQGDLNATKQRGGELRLSGSVETLRGTYEIYGRRFRIERGEVVLDGSAEPDPVLDVRALHRVRDVKIYAIIEGRLSEPRLRFESEPELDETDIASYLLLGRPASGSAGEDQLALEAVAAQVAMGAAVREFERLFGGALPVDVIDLRMEDAGEGSELRAGVGKYVGDRLFLHYERGFGDEPEDELKAEYELTPSWSIESTISIEGETAGDLVFEIEY